MATSAGDARLKFARLLQRGLDLPAYFDAVDRELKRHLAFEASCWLSLDPAVLLPTSHFSREYGFSQFVELAGNEFLEDDYNKFVDLAASPRGVGILSQATGGELERSPRHVKFLVPYGFGQGDELRAVLRHDDEPWGAVALHRRLGCFTVGEAELLSDLGDLLAHGIRRAILRSALAADQRSETPAVILLRADDSVESMSPAAKGWVAELLDSTTGADTVPLTVVSVAKEARRAAAGQADAVAGVRLPRRSGGWLRIDASLLEDQSGRIAVIIGPAREPEVAGMIARAYGLSARERDVARLVLQGRSTAEMAAALHVSGYTVQDHLKSIFEKIGVRSRRELVAQLFQQQCAPRLLRGDPPGVDGWFAEGATGAPSLVGPGSGRGPRDRASESSAASTTPR